MLLQEFGVKFVDIRVSGDPSDLTVFRWDFDKSLYLLRCKFIELVEVCDTDVRSGETPAVTKACYRAIALNLAGDLNVGKAVFEEIRYFGIVANLRF